MDILDRLLGHDHWTTRHLLIRCRELSPAHLTTPFDLGHQTLQATLVHVVRNLEVWTDLLLVRPIRGIQDDANPDDSVAGFTTRWDASYREFAAFARQAQAEDRLDALWTDILDNPPAQKTIGGTIVHVITHNMHHRSEILHMLARLGVDRLIEGDALSWERHYNNNPDDSTGEEV